MPNWNELLLELQRSGSSHDIIRRKYLAQLSKHTGRNTIVYYSGWLQKTGIQGLEVNDADKNGLMTVIHNLDRTRGLDLLLHTPGGEVAATESIVDYLRAMFGTDIRAIVPQLAMSAGTMIACACREIVMGKQSSLGPIDPQLSGIPAHGVIEEFERAYQEIKKDSAKIPIWQPVLAKYPPAFVGECEKAMSWASELALQWLKSGMFARKRSGAKRIPSIIKELTDHAITKSHGRHLSLDRCRSIGLQVVALESDSTLQDAVLSVHHACIHTLGGTNAFKIIENHDGVAFIQLTQNVAVRA